MRTTIEELNPSVIQDVNRCNGEFVIDSRLVLYVEKDEIRYEIIAGPASKKRYDSDDVDYTPYIDNPDKAVFLAYVEGRIAGQIILRVNWNRYAYIEDIAVDVQFRRQGIGMELMTQARRWAQDLNLAGIMLETQNNNVAACRFYENCGFQLGGFDRYLYRGINKEIDEVALFWYLVFKDTPS